MWQSEKNPVKYFSFDWTYRHISPETKKYLQGFPEQKKLERKGMSFLLVHGSPVSVDEALGPDTSKKHLKSLAQKTDVQVILCGHSHRPFVRKVGQTWFVNPGSAGRSFDKDTRASYAIITVNKKRLKIRHYRVDYDVDSVIWAMEKADFPREFRQSIMAGISVNDVEDIEKKENQEEKIEAAQRLSDRLSLEKGHVRQVVKLTLLLFDRLYKLHGLGIRERIWLEAASLLHDIGVAQDVERHHKVARDVIIKDWSGSPFTIREKMIIGSIVRYHRETLPKSSHKYYHDLDKHDKKVVDKLAALLRLADGLDRSHQNVVKNITCRMEKRKIVCKIETKKYLAAEDEFGKKKSDLFEWVFGKKIKIEWKV
jgi:predicted phosphodiesterase